MKECMTGYDHIALLFVMVIALHESKTLIYDVTVNMPGRYMLKA
jgi:hypothetical protein